MQIRIPVKIQIRLENFSAILLFVKCNVDPKNIKIRLKNIDRFLQNSNTYQQNPFLLFEKCAVALVFACKIINANLANRNPIYQVPKLMKSIRCFQTKSYKNLRFHQNCMLFELAGSAVLDLDAKMNASLTILVVINHLIPLDKIQSNRTSSVFAWKSIWTRICTWKTRMDSEIFYTNFIKNAFCSSRFIIFHDKHRIVSAVFRNGIFAAQTMQLK